MSQEVKGGVGPRQVLVAKWISGGAAVTSIAVGALVAILDWEMVIANGAFALAIIAAFSCIATIHAQHVTQHTDMKVRELQEETEERIFELSRAIRIAGIFADHAKRVGGS